MRGCLGGGSQHKEHAPYYIEFFLRTPLGGGRQKNELDF